VEVLSSCRAALLPLVLGTFNLSKELVNDMIIVALKSKGISHCQKGRLEGNILGLQQETI